MMAYTGHTNPDSDLPVDQGVPLPPGVAAAAAAAEALHKSVYSPQPDPAAAPVSPQPDPAAPNPAPQPDPAPAPQPQPPAPVSTSTPEQRSGVDPSSWEGRFYAMEGRWKASQNNLGAMQEQMSELGDELVRTQARVANPPAADGQRPAGQAPRRHVTEDDVKTLGPEMIEAMARIARDAVAPDLGRVQQGVRQVSQRVGQVTQADMITTLAQEVPNWQEINVMDRFKSWCRSPDVYSGQVRGKLLNAAFQAADAPRVIAFFKGFLAEEQATGQLPVPQPQPQPNAAPREAAVNLESLTAPGRPKPAGGQSAPVADKPVFTRAQISYFYSHAGRAAYTGREADRKRDEAAIFDAQRDGRVRG